MRQNVKRGLLGCACMLVILSAGCAGKTMGTTGETGATEGTARQEMLNMPAAEVRAPAGNVPTRFDCRKIYFEFDRHNLNTEGRQTLAEMADYLREHQELRLDIEGHCDERGTSEYNIALGERRACEARNFLVTMGVDADRISTISYGEENPEDPGKTEEAWSRNRRDQFLFSR